MNAVLSLSVRDAVYHAAEDLSAREALIAQEFIKRAWERMPKIAEFMTEGLVEKFIDLACSVPRLSPIDGELASLKECEKWLKEITAESHIALPCEEYRACAYRLIRNVLCFSKHDLTELDLGFYKAMMAFVRPMRDAVTQYNVTH